MKKKGIFAIAALLITLLCAVFVLTGCEGNPPDSVANTTWKVSEMESGGMKLTGEQLQQLGGDLTITFHEDTVTLTVSGMEPESPKPYTYQDGTVTIENENFVVRGNQMTIEDNGSKIVFTKQN